MSGPLELDLQADVRGSAERFWKAIFGLLQGCTDCQLPAPRLGVQIVTSWKFSVPGPRLGVQIFTSWKVSASLGLFQNLMTMIMTAVEILRNI